MRENILLLLLFIGVSNANAQSLSATQLLQCTTIKQPKELKKLFKQWGYKTHYARERNGYADYTFLPKNKELYCIEYYRLDACREDFIYLPAANEYDSLVTAFKVAGFTQNVPKSSSEMEVLTSTQHPLVQVLLYSTHDKFNVLCLQHYLSGSPCDKNIMMCMPAEE